MKKKPAVAKQQAGKKPAALNAKANKPTNKPHPKTRERDAVDAAKRERAVAEERVRELLVFNPKTRQCTWRKVEA